MEEFCGSEFWNTTVTWYSEYPILTECFQKTVLVWVPCIFLWIFSPLEAYYIINSKTRNIPWNWLNVSKLILMCILMILSILDCGFSIRESGEVYSVDYYTPLIKVVSFCLTAILLWHNKQRGLRTSGLLFLFWFFLMLLGAIQFQSEIWKEINEDDFRSSHNQLHHFTNLISFPIVVVLVLLNCMADAAPQFTEYPISENPCPEQDAAFLSRLFFAWFDPLAWKGYRKPLETKDLWSLNPEDTAHEIIPRFDKYWQKSLKNSANVGSPNASFHKNSVSVDLLQKQSRKTQASILPAMCRAFGATFLFASLFKLVQVLLTFVSPQILKLLIKFVEEKENMEEWKGYFYATLLFLAASVQTLFLAQYLNRMFVVGLRIRTALVSAIYKKALRLSSAARKESTVGEIVNLMSVDAQRFATLTADLSMLWAAPLQIALALYFLWHTLGPSVLSGLAVLIILIPVNGLVAKRVKILQTSQMKNKDERVKLMNEVLSGIKVLKLYAWEPSFEQQVLKIRDKELRVLKQAAYLNAATSIIWACAPFVVSLVTFATYILIDEENQLTPANAFVSLTLFNIMRMPLTLLPMFIVNVVQASVSIKRINKFMNAEELDPNNVTHENSEKDPLVIENGTFSWGPDEHPVLRNINIHIKTGSLVAVVGSVGSGKSSLISAFLGEMEKLTGRVNAKGSIAYVSQQAWIQNATLKDNIVFGKSVDQASYKRVVEACALKQDFDMLPAGDQTEIGEKGINLSGGQKQRVSLARSVYNNADMYFLDDPLSAVDSHVGKHIFENVVGPAGLLKKKTRLLVTHGITFLPEVDQIIVLRDGEVTETGTYKELLEKKGAFADFLLQHLQEGTGDDDSSQADLDELKQQLESTMGAEEFQQKLTRARSRVSESESGSVEEKRSHSLSGSLHRQKSVESNAEERSYQRPSLSEKDFSEGPITGEKLIEVEKAETGSVKWTVYSHYLKSAGIILSLLTIALNIVFQGFSVGSNIWLARWSEENETDTTTRDTYLGVYGALGIGQAFASFYGDLFPMLGSWKAAKVLHVAMLYGVMRAPLLFFDVTPSGRILGRFAKDIDVLDNTLPRQISDMLYCFFEVIATLVVISFSTPIFISVILPIGILYYFVQRFYVATSRQLKRLESVSRSPIYSHFGESITGAPTIRAYGIQTRFITESENKVDFNQICYYPTIIANRWLAVRLEMVGNLIIFFAALFAVLSKDIDEGKVGLSISYALQITQTLNWLVRMSSDVETNIVAVERIKEYTETAQEAPWDIPSTVPSNEWPEKGEVNFKNYELRYREGLELVLKGVTFTVKGGEKVGIVGRTGAGKSSLTLALFRIIEAAGGNIVIDGRDISTLGLHALRSRLTIIPQDPVLFSGTLRMNLDPFGKYSDDDVWCALEHAHMKSFVKGLTAGLNHEVSEGGENMSVGQRQLICLARALLRKTKVLVSDEATAAVDLETDDLIQATIRAEFNECTVLTIAHRLNTIMDSNRILVLDKGNVVEYDSPEALLQRKNSIFYGMAKDAGLI